MKRPQSGIQNKRTGVVAQDLSTAQLAGVGKIAFAYNEAEHWLHLMAASALGAGWVVGSDVSRRINGVDGLIEVIKSALTDLNCPADAYSTICISFGPAGFQELKTYRDRIIHARIVDAEAGIGVSYQRRGKFEDILLTENALNGVYERLEIIRLELGQACVIAMRLRAYRVHFRNLVDFPEAPEAEDERERSWQRLLREIQDDLSQIREHQKRRQHLPRLPEFPPEFPDAETTRRHAIAAALLASDPQPDQK